MRDTENYIAKYIIYVCDVCACILLIITARASVVVMSITDPKAQKQKPRGQRKRKSQQRNLKKWNSSPPFSFLDDFLIPSCRSPPLP